MNKHYFTATDTVTEAELSSFEVELQGHRYLVDTAAEVFSNTRLDPGTAVLLDKVPAVTSAKNCLDLGCGWGPITLALARQAGEATVWAADINSRARQLTSRNVKRAGFKNVRVVAPEDGPEEIDLIWSNPPVRIGKTALHELLETWLTRLSTEGKAYLVVQKNLGADSLAKWLVESGFPCQKIASAKGYRILEVSPRNQNS